MKNMEQMIHTQFIQKQQKLFKIQFKHKKNSRNFVPLEKMKN